jgi:hypothetical protein
MCSGLATTAAYPCSTATARRVAVVWAGVQGIHGLNLLTQFGQQGLRLFVVKVGVLLFAHAMRCQLNVNRWRDAMLRQGRANAGQRTSVNGHDGARLGCGVVQGSQQVWDVATYTCDAGHLCLAFPIQPHGQVIGQLCGTGAA